MDTQTHNRPFVYDIPLNTSDTPFLRNDTVERTVKKYSWLFTCSNEARISIDLDIYPTFVPISVIIVWARKYVSIRFREECAKRRVLLRDLAAGKC